MSDGNVVHEVYYEPSVTPTTSTRTTSASANVGVAPPTMSHTMNSFTKKSFGGLGKGGSGGSGSRDKSMVSRITCLVLGADSKSLFAATSEGMLRYEKHTLKTLDVVKY